ncbi:MAG TPA: xanthine dehydrogenase small subunit [Burkholderiaceae bacterium]|nr:xanthine dehydrogenase small subunit [Burkholderiaceae bacterium]
MAQRSTVTFYLNDRLHQVQAESPTLTLLQYLREHLDLAGTKEGCAEGDCGACTIVEASLDRDGRPCFRPVNACIRFLPTLDGKALWTVEGLTAPDGSLHPVQQAMIDHHGSQCGFCTPGFIMSLYAMYAQGVRHPNRDQVVDQLSGNLCRCTGYRPIIDAGMGMGRYPAAGPDHGVVREQLHQLQSQCARPLGFTWGQQSYLAPRSVAELADQLQRHPDALLLAGGTDVGLWVTKQLRTLDHIIYLGDVPELHTMQRSDGMLSIGAAVLLDDAWREITRDYPELTEIWKRFASTPIRCSGTLVGNLGNGSPIGDTAPALIALGARVVLRLGADTRQMALEDLYVDYGKQARKPGEFIEAVLIPERDPDLLVASYKLSKRYDQDISAVCSAYAIRLDQGVVASVRIAHGGMAATSRRAIRTEAALLGQPWLEPAVREAMQALADDYQPLTDMRATDSYRMKAAQNLLYRFFLETGSDIPTRVYSGDSHVFT